MSSAVLPSLVGLGFDVTRTPAWDTIVQQAISGKETRIAKQTFPRWKWELSYNVLRSNIAYGELQELVGFFNARQGKFDTFLYADPDDNQVVGQQVAQGDGTTTSFQLVRNFGGFVEPVLAPNSVNNVYLAGAVQSSGSYSVTSWGNANPGVITFSSAPANGAIITADFSYYFPVRMTDDSVPFTLFISQYYKAKKFAFISVKN